MRFDQILIVIETLRCEICLFLFYFCELYVLTKSQSGYRKIMMGYIFKYDVDWNDENIQYFQEYMIHWVHSDNRQIKVLKKRYSVYKITEKIYIL